MTVREKFEDNKRAIEELALKQYDVNRIEDIDQRAVDILTDIIDETIRRTIPSSLREFDLETAATTLENLGALTNMHSLELAWRACQHVKKLVESCGDFRVDSMMLHAATAVSEAWEVAWMVDQNRGTLEEMKFWTIDCLRNAAIAAIY